MDIGIPRITQEFGQLNFQVEIISAQGKADLWYRFDASHNLSLSPCCDAPLIAMLVPAMARGEGICVEGPVSGELLQNIPRLQKLLQSINPRLRNVKIEAPADTDRLGPAPGVATGFSGGVDSFSVLADHYYAAGLGRFKVSTLLFNNVGSHGRGEKGEALFRKRYKRLVPLTERIGLPFVAINSNLDSFYSKDINFQQNHTLRNASVALLLQASIGRYLSASSARYQDLFVGPTHDCSYCDAITLPLFSTDKLQTLSVGSEYSRVEKTLQAAEISDAHSSLDICVNSSHKGPPTNCSTCWKCLRTLATLEIAGKLERFSASFDLAAYRAHRERYFGELLGSSEPLLKEIVCFARQMNFQFPVASRAAHFFRIGRLAKLAANLSRKGKRG